MNFKVRNSTVRLALFLFLYGPPLSLFADTNCAPVPSGLIGWWRADGTALQTLGTHNGSLVGNTTYGTGKSGQAFVLDGSQDGVIIQDSPDFHLQSFSIEAWVKRADSSRASLDPWQSGGIFEGSWAGYAFALWDDGRLLLGKIGYDNISSSFAITDTTNFHHVAVIKDGTNVTFYLDGVGETVGPYNTFYTFSGPMAIGTRGNDLVGSFLGSLDEVSIYNRPLAPAEILAIYNAGGFGKCAAPVAPNILQQPTNLMVFEGSTAIMDVKVSGSPPLSFQWFSSGTPVAGQTQSSLVLTNVQTNQSGIYSLTVSNAAGVAISSNATLLITQSTNCVYLPAGLVRWWRAEGNASDAMSTNVGIILADTKFGVGKVGQGFVFDGAGDGVQIADSTDLHLQTFTIEAWIKRASSTSASLDTWQSGEIFAYTWGGYALALWDDGRPLLGKVGYDFVSPAFAITDTNLFHHVAVTKNGTNVVFYLDGTGQSVGPYNTSYVFNGPAGIGTRGNDFAASFLGSIDEVSIFNRALSAAEVQSIYIAGSNGKCTTVALPNVMIQPTNQTASLGSSVSLVIVASGASPFFYQWFKNGSPIIGAVSSTLVITNIQLSNAGPYSVLVTNVLGSILSSNAVITVTVPPAAILSPFVQVSGGTTFSKSIYLQGHGIENNLGFSVNWDPAKLKYSGVLAGMGAPAAQILVNVAQVTNGRLGISVSLPQGQVFPTGSNELVKVTYDAAVLTNDVSTALWFGDDPVSSYLADGLGNMLPAYYLTNGVLIAAPSFEADVWPRPNGDKGVGQSDLNLIGRYAAHLDSPTNSSELQRADCAPRSTLGDGALTVIDLVQAGRYYSHLDSARAVGGPTSAASIGTSPSDQSPRKFIVSGKTMFPSVMDNLAVNLVAQGDENAVGFSIGFDPARLDYLGSTSGSDATGGTFYVNENQVSVGKVGFVLALAPGATFPKGSIHLVNMNFQAKPQSAGDTLITLSNLPVPREISNTNAEWLSWDSVHGNVAIHEPPSLRISSSNQILTLSWPLWASNFVLQQSESMSAWTNVPASINTNSSDNFTTILASEASRFYRLQLP